MNRRKFIENLNVGILSVAIGQLSFQSCTNMENKVELKIKNWAWFPSFHHLSDKELEELFVKMKKSGIHAVIPQVYNGRFASYESKNLPVSKPLLKKLITMAKSAGLEIHAWMWAMPNNIPEIGEKHPEWFAVNRNGDSALDKPAYVDYYKFMCPNQEGVQNFLQKNVEELAQFENLDGVHLDYIRYPDVILTKPLQKKYDIVQDREYPEYDYCYCSVCRSKFKEKTGVDPIRLDEPDLSEEWNQFRYDSMTNLINNILVPTTKKFNKTITAAVFPNWKMVRQQWSKWNMDAFMPMLYHSLYGEGLDWIEEQVAEGVNSLPKKIPLYSGLTVSKLKPGELVQTLENTLKAGGRGVSLFTASGMTENHWEALSQFMNLK